MTTSLLLRVSDDVALLRVSDDVAVSRRVFSVVEGEVFAC